jgi:hypothetical protein
MATKPHPKTYDWVLTGKFCSCFKSPANKQVLPDFWEVTEAVPFHDAALSRLTTDIKSILSKVARNADKKLQLSIINVEGRPFLVWARTLSGRPAAGGIRSDDNPARILRSFKLKGPGLQKPKTPRSWVLDSTGIMHCKKGCANDCIVRDFWETAEFTPWHTEELASATTQIKARVNEVAGRNTDPNRHLAILFYDYRPLLAWVQHHVVSRHDDKNTVVRAMRLKTR